MMCNIVPQTARVEELQEMLIHIEVAARILVAIPSWEAPSSESQPRDEWKPIPTYIGGAC